MTSTTLGALVVHCSSGHLQPIFREFLEGTLKLGEYDLLAIPGGPQALAALDYLPKFAWAGGRWTKFLVDAHGLKRIVLIAHEDCAWYKQLHGDHAQMEQKQRADLIHSRDHLRQALPGVTVEAWFVTLDGSHEKLPESAQATVHA